MSTMHQLARRYATTHPDAAAKVLEGFDTGEAAAFLASLEPAAAAAVVAEMWPRTAADIVERIAPDHTVQVLEMLNLSRTAALLRQLSADARDRILTSLSPPLASRVRKALSLSAGTAGAAADTGVTPFDEETTVGEALARASDPRLPYLYVVDREYRLVGVVHRRELEISNTGAVLRSIMKAPVQKIPAAAPLAPIHQHSAWSDFDAMPVVDGGNAFIGVIRHKALRAAPRVSRAVTGPAPALTALLDLGEIYWSGLYSAIEVVAEGSSKTENGDIR